MFRVRSSAKACCEVHAFDENEENDTCAENV